MNAEQVAILEKLAEEKKYGRGPAHAGKVMSLSLKIYDELSRLALLVNSANDKSILQSAALLHDTGLPGDPHNEKGFDMLSLEIPSRLSNIPLTPGELSTILYCVLWHRGSAFNKRGNIEVQDLTYVTKMASILRVADALDRSLGQIVEDVNLSFADGYLNFAVFLKHSADTEIGRAGRKSDLMKKAFGLTGISFYNTGVAGAKK